MASRQESQPALMSATRRFGRCETFRRFDHLSSGHASVGTKTIGKMTVDCQFLFKKSRWGVLGDSRFPAGIIYLDLNFGPPQGCRVKSASIVVTLDEDDECLRPYKDQPGRMYHMSECPVQMTDWYGPKQLAGEQKTVESKRTIRLTPEVNVFGTGGGGLGVDSEKTFQHSSRWAFNGQLLPGRGTWTYKTLKWDLTENQLEDQPFRSSRVHTAFTFEHSGQPFLMKIEIEGKLEKWNDRVKTKLKFGSSKSKEEGQATTLIDFEDLDSFQCRLDELARSLPRAMEMENYGEIPIQVPNNVPTSFHAASLGINDSATGKIEFSENDPQQQNRLDGIPAHPSLQAPRIPQSICNGPNPAIQDLPETDLEDLRRVAFALSHPHEEEIIREPQNSFSSSSSTQVMTEEEQEEKPPVKDEVKTDITLKTPDIDQEAMLKILQIPALFAFLQLIARFVNLFGEASDRTKLKVV